MSEDFNDFPNELEEETAQNQPEEDSSFDQVEPIKERLGSFETIEIELTEEEKLQLGQELAELQIEIERIENEKSATNKRLGEQIKDLSAESLAIAKKLEAGAIEKQVECKWRLDYPLEGQKTLIAVGTGKEIRTEGMSLFDTPENEAQAEDNEGLFGTEGAAVIPENNGGN